MQHVKWRKEHVTVMVRANTKGTKREAIMLQKSKNSAYFIYGKQDCCGKDIKHF